MGCILIGILVVVLILSSVWIAKKLGGLKASDWFSLIFFLCFSILLVSVFTGIFADVSGYEEPVEVEIIELVGIPDSKADSATGVVYVSTYAGESVFSYYKNVLSEESGEVRAYESDYIWGGNITIVEDDEYRYSPRLVAYERKARKTFWALGIGYPNVNYVFYVPVGSVVISE